MSNPDIMKSMGEEKNKDDLIDTKYKLDDNIIIDNLKSEKYNKKNGIIKGFDKKNNRYLVQIEELDKSISIKEDNCFSTD